MRAPGAGDDDRGQRPEPVAGDRLGDHVVPSALRSKTIAAKTPRRDEAERTRRSRRRPRRSDDGDEHAPSRQRPTRPGARASARARASRSVGCRDHLRRLLRGGADRGNEWSVIAAGQAERTSRIATSGTSDASSPGAGRAPFATAGPGAVQYRRDQPQHVHRREHDRHRADHRVAPALAGRPRPGSRTRPRTPPSRAPPARSRRWSSAPSPARAARAPSRRARELAGRVRRSTRPRAGTGSPRSGRG